MQTRAFSTVEKLRFSDRLCSDFAEHESSESSHAEASSPVSVKRFVVALGKHAVNALLQQRPAAEGRVGREQRLRFLACVLHEREVCGEVCHVQRRETVLAAAEKVAGATLREVGARDFKAIIRLTEDFQPFPGGRALVCAEKDAVGLRGRAADAAATDRNGLHPRRP